MALLDEPPDDGHLSTPTPAALNQPTPRAFESKPLTNLQLRILAAGDGRPKPVNLYVTRVKASFLDRLDFPSQEPAVGSGLDIDH
jgi:hypothetical protein